MAEKFKAVHIGDSKRYHRFGIVSEDKQTVGNIYITKGTTLPEMSFDLVTAKDKEYRTLKNLYETMQEAR